MNNDKLIEFLTELTKLTDKYGFEIGGCGCCGSPWVTSDGEDGGVRLEYDEEKSCYRVDLYDGYDYHEPIYVYGTPDSLKCSVCGYNHKYPTTYCSNCGARMDGDNNENNQRR